MTEGLKKIIKVLKKRESLKAKEIVSILNTTHKTQLKRKDVNSILYKYTNDIFICSGFPFYRWSLINNNESSTVEKPIIHNTNINSDGRPNSIQDESNYINKEISSISDNNIKSFVEENKFGELKIDLLDQFNNLRRIALHTRPTVDMSPLRDKYLNTVELLIKEIINFKISEDIIRDEFKNYTSTLHLILNNKNFKEYRISHGKNLKEQQSSSDLNIKNTQNDYKLDIDINRIGEDESTVNSNNKWSIRFDNSIQTNIDIDYRKKFIVFKYKKDNDLEEFINNLFKEKGNHRNPEVDLFFENFEEFYK